MNNIMNFMKLIRIQNLLLIILVQYLIRYFLIKSMLIPSALSDIYFLYLVLATVFIAAAGYIINDIYDIKIDEINNKNNIINTRISLTNAKIYYILLNITGLLLGIILAFKVNHPLLSLIFLYCIITLWLYSKHMKRTFLIGNLQISLLSSLAIINIAFFDLFPIIKGKISAYNYNNHEYIHDIPIDQLQLFFNIILIYGVFGFLLSLIREIIKDMEDVQGDKCGNAKTVVILWGQKKTKLLTITISVFIICLIARIQYLQYSIIASDFSLLYQGIEYEKIEFWGVNIISIIYVYIIQSFLLILIYKILKSSTKEQFRYISLLIKIIMLLGILSIPLFSII